MHVTPEQVLQTAWVVWLISWVLAAAWRKPTATRVTSGHEAPYRLLIVAGVLVQFRPWMRSTPFDLQLWQPSRGVAWTLAALAVGGFLFTWWARLVLGRLWSSNVRRTADHVIVMTGPYRLVRHPIYSGLILAVSATAVMRGTAASCLGAVLVGLGLFVKARIEERFLKQELGEQSYAAYARRVPMLVPMIRRS